MEKRSEQYIKEKKKERRAKRRQERSIRKEDLTLV